MSLNKPVAIIGAGPVGLAALAHCITNDIDAQLYEAHKNIAPAMAEWGSAHMFSPSSWNIYPEAVSLLKEAQWSPDQLSVQ
jgi:2-polyprenyl-6-methoxyphenol hydroxylase-like FAD-dependent oxidoreductase